MFYAKLPKRIEIFTNASNTRRLDTVNTNIYPFRICVIITEIN